MLLYLVSNIYITINKEFNLKRKSFDLDSIFTYENVEWAYHNVCKNCRSISKKTKFSYFSNSNIFDIYNRLNNFNYYFSKYKIFIIKDPKYRVIMSDTIYDKIVNYVVAYKILLPALSSSLIDQNVATRKGMGAKKAYYYFEKYANTLKNNGNVYVLKIDIKKYFYNINHLILMNLLKRYIKDELVLKLILSIINQTNSDYINKDINYLKENVINDLYYKNISIKEKNELIKKIKEIPLYKDGKGLSIGNVCSQILAVFYLNEFDHYVKEKLKCKYYIRYMDDIIVLSNDKLFLKNIYNLIEIELSKYDLSVNPKSNIYKLNNSFTFLGRTYYIKKDNVFYRCRSVTYNGIIKKINYLRNKDFKKYYPSKISYRGYLKKDIYSLKEEYIFLSSKYNNVIVKDFVNDYGYVIYSNISDDIINTSLYLNGICCINYYNYKKIINYLDISNIKYIYLEKTKIIFKFDC